VLVASPMEHNGIRYRVLRTSNPTSWEWIVCLDKDKTRWGLSYSRESAIFNAKCEIDKALDCMQNKLGAASVAEEARTA
jgi:hypothetical protein